MSMLEAFKFKTSYTAIDAEIASVWPFSVKFDFFVESDILSIYNKILSDVIQRTQGIPDEVMNVIWDNCLQNQSQRGLVNLIAKAMERRTDLYLVYKVGVLREASNEEKRQINEDYAKFGSSEVGIHVSFKNYLKTEMLRIYSAMEYSILNSLNKTLNLSSAIQFKMSKMRDSVGAVDKAQVVADAKSVAEGLRKGNDVLIDKDDEIVTATPQIDPTKQSIAFLDAKRSFYLGLPLSYITGEQTAGIGSTGEADTKAIERGLKQYYVSIVKPVLKALFDIDTSFKSEDFRQISSALEAIKTFELVGDDMLSAKEKKLVIAKLFDIEVE